MNKKHLSRRLTALLLCCCLFFSACGGLFDPELEPAPDGRRTIRYSKMEYTRPDVDAQIARMEELTTGIQNAASFEELWALDEEAEAISEEFSTMSTLAELRKYLDTTNSSYQEEYRYCSENGVRLSNAVNALNKAIIEGPYAKQYEEKIGSFIYQSILDGQRLNSPEVEALKTRRNQLNDDYNEQLTTLTIPFEGKEYTVAQLGELDEPMMAFVLEQAFYQLHADTFTDLYIELIGLDREIAQTLGFASVADMYYLSYGRDYTPADALAFCESSKEHIVPLLPEMLAASTGYTLKQKDCFEMLPAALEEVSPELREAWEFMQKYEVCDYDAQSKKQAGIAFTTSIAAYDTPYCYGYWEDDLRSATTVIHEFGHFYDRWLTWDIDTSPSLDISESYSQGLELLMQKDFGALTGDAEGAVQEHLGDFAQALTYQALLEEFQQELYQMDNLTPESISGLYTEMLTDYGYGDYLYPAEDGLDYSWIAITHLFDAPFYTISYSTSATIALQIWEQSQEDWRTGADTYLKLIHADQNQPFTALVESVGLKAPQDPDVLPAIAEAFANSYDILVPATANPIQ